MNAETETPASQADPKPDYLPGNYCKIPGCTEPFAYDHRCEMHTEDDDDA